MLCAVRVFDPSRTVALAQARGQRSGGRRRQSSGGPRQCGCRGMSSSCRQARRSPGLRAAAEERHRLHHDSYRSHPKVCRRPTSAVGPEHAGRLARIQSKNGTPALRTGAGRAPLEAGAPRVRAEPGRRRRHHRARRRLLRAIHPRSRPARSGRRSLLHPRRSCARQKRGIALNSASTTVIGSYISDIKSSARTRRRSPDGTAPAPS